MSFTASAHSIGGGLRQEVEVNRRHTIVTDEPRALGGTDAGPAPHELMPAMIAACVSTTLALYAKRHGWQVEGLSVDVTYDADVSPRHVELTTHLPSGLTAEQVTRLERVAATCPVRRAFEAGFAFDEHIASRLPAAA
jgi:putative redox protein